MRLISAIIAIKVSGVNRVTICFDSCNLQKRPLPRFFPNKVEISYLNSISFSFSTIVGVANGGYAIIRIWTDNPGWWLFHCHIDFHLGYGMAMVLQVGDKWEIPPPPPYFPK